MNRILRVDAGPIVDVQGVRKGVLDEDILVEDTLDLLRTGKIEESDTRSDIVGAFNEFMKGPEQYQYNGIKPSENVDEANKLRRHWQGFALGKEFGPALKNKSKLAGRVESEEELDAVSEEELEEISKDIDAIEDWIIEHYEERGDHQSESAYIQNGFVQLETNLGIVDEEENALRVLKTTNISERDILDGALRLKASDADSLELLAVGDEMRRLELTDEHASDIIGDDIEEIVKESSNFYSNVINKTAEEIRSQTNIGFESLQNHSFLNLLISSEINNRENLRNTVQEGISKASKSNDSYNDIKNDAADYVSQETGIIFPHYMSADQFLSNMSEVTELSADINEILKEKAIGEAEKILNVEQSEDSVKDLLNYLDGGIFRDTDVYGNRVYRWDGKSAYSVTTIIDPFPNRYDNWDDEKRREYPFHREIDTGGGLFHWKNIYDGSNGRYDADIVRDYAGDRGTLAHEEVFSNYVEDESEVRGQTERFWKNLEEIKPSKNDLGDLQDIVDWKENDPFEVLNYDKCGQGMVQNGRELAEKEIKWIEEQFRDLEEDLGLDKDNVICAEQEFALETQHPWDSNEAVEGPGIGTFSYGGTVDMIYEHEETGEIILLDLKTGSMKPNYAVQQAAYKHAVENSEFFDDPRLENGIDRLVIPEIDPETMMYSDKGPVLHTDQPHQGEKYTTSKFLDASGIDLESTEYRENRWRPENWYDEALYLFARGAEQMNQGK